MLTYTYVSKGKFALTEKPKPHILHERDAIVKVTLASICSSDLHIKHGSVPRAVEGITVGHEMVGIVEEVGSAVTHVKAGDRVTVNVETFCGDCFFCKNGFVNNCTDQNGGWALGCRIDGGQAEFVRVPFADTGLNKIPDTVTDRQALLVGDVLATGYWAAKISEIGESDTVLIIGGGPTGICTLLCVMLKNPKRIILCEKDENRIAFVNKHYPSVLTVLPENCIDFVLDNSDHGGADVVLEVAGAENTFALAWRCARPNAVVTVVALYSRFVWMNMWATSTGRGTNKHSTRRSLWINSISMIYAVSFSGKNFFISATYTITMNSKVRNDNTKRKCDHRTPGDGCPYL